MLELFFDLVFVVAVSATAAQLHHQLSENHLVEGVTTYLLAFFGVWWAWMNFTWFATSFDNDDWLYRLVTFVQMGGVLVLAAGAEPAFTEEDFTWTVIGYVIMRVAMVTQWLRASRSAGPHHTTTIRYAMGIGGLQVLWIAWLAVPDSARTVVFLLLIAAELAVPVIAERSGGTPWHPHHITERYGLFTLILLGESLLGSAMAIFEAIHEDHAVASLIALAILAMVVTAGLWWIYFWAPHHSAIGRLSDSLRYGYTHYFVFAAAGAFSAGIGAEVDVLTDHAKLSDAAASFAVTIPITIFILGIWWIVLCAHADRVVNTVVPLGALVMLLDPVLPTPVILPAVVTVVIVATLVTHPIVITH